MFIETYEKKKRRKTRLLQIFRKIVPAHAFTSFALRLKNKEEEIKHNTRYDIIKKTSRKKKKTNASKKTRATCL